MMIVDSNCIYLGCSGSGDSPLLKKQALTGAFQPIGVCRSDEYLK